MSCYVIEFGSKARGDNDLSSDKDVLLIGKNWAEIELEKIRYKQLGFSVSAFKEDKARFLIDHGSLFFKHILDEGLFINGEFDSYSQLINNWRSARDYSEEIDENLDLLEVLSYIPESQKGIASAIDILICSIRNILIRRLANHGVFVFSWKRIFAEAKVRGIINEVDVLVFTHARKIKNLYREAKPLFVSKEFLESLRSSSGRALGVRVNTRFTSDKSEQIKLPTKFEDSSYKQLRAIELMCGIFNDDPSIIPLLNAVQNPSYFGSSRVKLS